MTFLKILAALILILFLGYAFSSESKKRFLKNLFSQVPSLISRLFV